LSATTGWAVSTLAWRMREPVISMRSRLVVLSPASCAKAGVVQLAASAMMIALRGGLQGHP